MDSSEEEEIQNNLRKSLTLRDEDLNLINILPTFNKMSVTQALLKEMVSIKDRFDENKNKMIEKIQFNTYKYYKNLIISKEIHDNCILKEEGQNDRGTYTLISNANKVLDEHLYLPIYNFLFLLRNNNKYMLRIINRCYINDFDQLSYFIAHFCYENTINNNNSFIQEELQLIIYFLIEKIIYKNPEEILTYDDKIFLYNLLSYLIRKVDINNYLNEIFCDIITQVNNNKNNFIMEIKKEINDIDKIKNQKKLLFQKIKENDFEELNDKIKKIDKFFIDNDTPFEYLSEKLHYYENVKEKDQISLAMIYYLENNFNELMDETKEEDKFRNYYYFNILLDKSEKKNNKEKYIDNIKKKYYLIFSFIESLLFKIEESLSNIPQPIKNILNIFDFIIEKKMSENHREEKIIYYILMAKIKIFIGNIILPMIKYYYSITIINDQILTRSTTEFLKTIEIIFNAILEGKLFYYNIDPEYTLYNKFIIDVFPKVLKIAFDIGKNNKNKDSNKNISSILSQATNSFENIKDNNRIVNYNELKINDNKKENIEYQSICFNWEILSLLIKIVSKGRDIFINKSNPKEENKIFEDILNIKNEVNQLFSNNQMKKEYEFFFIDKIIYKNEFEEKIKSIIQDNFEINLKSDTNGEVERFKKCLSVILGYVGVLHKEDFLPFITPKENIEIFSNNKTKLLMNYKKYNLYQNHETINAEKNIKRQSKRISFGDRFFSRRKSVVTPYLKVNPKTDKTDAKIDFETDLFPQIMSLVKIELGNSFECETFQRIIFCLSYVQTHFDTLPKEYKENNYSLLFIEIIRETKIFIQELQNNILNEFLKKIRNIEKLNEIINKNYIKNKNMEKLFYIKYLHKKTKVYGNVVIVKNTKDIITKIKFVPKVMSESKLDFIKSFLNSIPNLIEYEAKLKTNEEDFLKMQEKIGLVDAINDYFKELKNSIKKIKILSKLTLDEFLEVLYELENYILKKLYIKIFPKKQSKEDIFIYKKCSRLSFIKPDNIIKDKKFKNINEKLLEVSIGYVKNMEHQKTPMDKINSLGKAINFLTNSMEFNSGKKDFGVDDLVPLLIYIIIKAKPERLYTNYNYCSLYLNSDLQKRQYGSLLAQMGLISNVIKNMKYNDLINVTKEQFGTDEVV